MNDEQKSILAKSYTLVKKGEAADSQKDCFPASADNDVYFLNELTEDEKQHLINTVGIPMTAAEMTKELSFVDLSSMTEKQGIKLPFTSFEQAGEMLGISSGKANALTIIAALAEKGGMGDTDMSALSDKISEMPGTITEQSAVRFVKDEYSSLGVDMNVLQQNAAYRTSYDGGICDGRFLRGDNSGEGRQRSKSRSFQKCCQLFKRRD